MLMGNCILKENKKRNYRQCEIRESTKVYPNYYLLILLQTFFFTYFDENYIVSNGITCNFLSPSSIGFHGCDGKEFNLT